jgi:hypothetical protein
MFQLFPLYNVFCAFCAFRAFCVFRVFRVFRVILWLCAAQDLSWRVCGSADVDLTALRRHTEYGGVQVGQANSTLGTGLEQDPNST